MPRLRGFFTLNPNIIDSGETPDRQRAVPPIRPTDYNMPSVFLSYSHHDRALAHELVRILENQSLEVWWDRELVAGDRFPQRIEDQIDRAGVVVVLWTSHSVKSEWVTEEANEARKLGKLIPVSINGTVPPLGLPAAAHHRSR